MDIYAIRRHHLIEAIKIAGSASAVAKRIGSTLSYIGTIINRTRNMGSNVARRIEREFGYPANAPTDWALGLAMRIEALPADLIEDLTDLLQIKEGKVRGRAEKALKSRLTVQLTPEQMALAASQAEVAFPPLKSLPSTPPTRKKSKAK